MAARRRWLVVLVGGATLSGCHLLKPAPVVFPPPPPVVCRSLSCDADPVSGSTTKPDGESAVAETADPEPIDLPTALRLANARNPEIALARERIREALARQDRAEVLWLPNLEFTPNWTRHDGQIQRSTGEVVTVSRSALFVGGGPALSVEVGEALYAPLAARQLAEARRAGAAAVANERLLDVALGYLELLQIYAEVQIAEETYRNARHLLRLTESHEKAGTGRTADTARARTEFNIRARERLELQGRAAVASAQLARLLYLPPEVALRPVEPAMMPIQVVPGGVPLPELIVQALTTRPELAENRALIEAALQRWRAARVAPLVPNLRISYSGGGFGGGRNDFFGDFDGRGDASALAQWQLLNLGLGNHAVSRERHSRYAQAVFQQGSLEARVAAQVVSAYRAADVLKQELAAAQEAVRAARESYVHNEEGVRRAPAQFRPIELLQAIQALARARQDYLRVVAEYNRTQFRLFTALGNPPLCALEERAEVPVTEPTVPPERDQSEQLPAPKAPAPDR